MTLSERLKAERKKAGLSQVQFAEKLGLNARTYASYERGERDISTALLLDICKTLNISSDRLLGNPAEPPEETEKPSPPDDRWERFRPRYEVLSDAEKAKIDSILDVLLDEAEQEASQDQ